jgi:hypothetical protein
MEDQRELPAGVIDVTKNSDGNHLVDLGWFLGHLVGPTTRVQRTWIGAGGRPLVIFVADTCGYSSQCPRITFEVRVSARGDLGAMRVTFDGELYYTVKFADHTVEGEEESGIGTLRRMARAAVTNERTIQDKLDNNPAH